MGYFFIILYKILIYIPMLNTCYTKDNGYGERTIVISGSEAVKL